MVRNVDTFTVGVCATRFCTTVDVVLDMMPAVVWALTGRWLWLEEDPPPAPGFTMRMHTRYITLQTNGNSNSDITREHQYEHEGRS